MEQYLPVFAFVASYTISEILSNPLSFTPETGKGPGTVLSFFSEVDPSFSNFYIVFCTPGIAMILWGWSFRSSSSPSMLAFLFTLGLLSLLCSDEGSSFFFILSISTCSGIAFSKLAGSDPPEETIRYGGSHGWEK